VRNPLTVVETHPVQYHAPVYRTVAERHDIPVRVIYGSDFSVAGYRDREFGSTFKWDVDLLSGYPATFLTRSADGGARTYDEVSPQGLAAALEASGKGPVMLLGYRGRFDRAAWLHTWRTRRPILFRAETADHARARGGLATIARDRILKQLYRRCARLLFIGRRSEEHYRRITGTSDRLVFSPYCVDTSVFSLDEVTRTRMRDEVRRELDATNRLVLLYSGKLSHRKGVDLLIDAAKELDETVRQRLLIVFVGDGELRTDLQARAAASPHVDVHFAGFRNQRDLSRYYHAADLFALPSRHSETWGLVVNEALHHGVPCVVTQSVGCAPDLVVPGETGEIVEPSSVSSLRDGIARALSLVGSTAVRGRCRAQVAGYTVDKAAEGIARAYREVA